MKILVLGGTGFVGSAVLGALKDHDVKTFGRHGDYQGSILHTDQLYEAMKDKDIVINLVGLTPVREPTYTSYRLVHVQGVKAIIEACSKAKIKRLVHVSALGADPHGQTEYLRTKGEGELLLFDMKHCTILRPSLIIDKENELVKMVEKSPFFPNIKALVQPIIREDMAQVVKLAALGKIKEQVIDVVGPEQLTLFDLAKKIRGEKMTVPIPLFIVKIGMWVASHLHLFGIGSDQIKNLSIDNVSQSKAIDKYISSKTLLWWLKND